MSIETSHEPTPSTTKYFGSKMVEADARRGCRRTSVGFDFKGIDYHFRAGGTYPGVPGADAELKAQMEWYRQEHDPVTNEPAAPGEPGSAAVFTFFETDAKGRPLVPEEDETAVEPDRIAALEEQVRQLTALIQASAPAAPAPAPAEADPIPEEPSVEPALEVKKPKAAKRAPAAGPKA